MKKIVASLILLCAITDNPITFSTNKLTWVEESSLIQITPFTHAVLNHYYLIERLKSSINFFKKIRCNIPTLIPFDNFSSGSSIAITQCIHQIKEKKNIEPLLHYWDTITTYKSVENKQDIIEYIALIFNLMILIKHKTAQTKCHTLEIYNQKQTDEIAFRFFLIHRLKKTYALLQQCKQLSLPTYKTSTAVDLSKNLHFTHPHICTSINKTAPEGMLDHTIHLFSLFNSYHYINDSLFIREFLYIIFITLCTIKNCSFALPIESDTDIAAIFNSYHDFLEKLSIEEILETIDVATKQISIKLAKHTGIKIKITCLLKNFFRQIKDTLLYYLPSIKK